MWISTKRILATSVYFLSFICLSQQSSSRRALSELPTVYMASLVQARDPAVSVDFNNPASHLSKILIPRPPDTENNTFVRNHLVSTLRALKWHVEEDSFTDMTPYGEKRFTNVIATKDPDAPRRLVLAAHFDSKYFPSAPQNQFVGATDSAAPCAILLDVAETLNQLLDQRQERLEQGLEDDEHVAETTLQLLFLDGEEAFKDWTATDSIYGARHLAEKWDTTYLAPHPRRRINPPPTELSTIEHFVLLDLLGNARPRIRSYFLTTAWLFDSLASTENRLGRSGAFKGTSSWSARESFFVPRTGAENNAGYIEDDHVPFLKRGVSILHVIASPFPSVWHTLGDGASALDLPTLERWSLIFRLFTAEYLGLKPEAAYLNEMAVEFLIRPVDVKFLITACHT
ncbi:glutaminyl-peptide cyclotransferase-like protein [Hysterangium stoloniferum]|nr:glutaminyl-peptide cyclotransferase-like protein [Hysterangium stoloniferum]